MPDCAIYNNRLIRASDINKYIDKNNDFTCYTCGKNLYFNEIYNTVGENSSNHETIKYTEYVFNFIHDKHDKHDNHDNNNSNQSIIDSDYKLCEINTYKKITQHKCIIFSNIIKYDYKNIIKLDDKYKHLLDGYDKINNLGIKFQQSVECKNTILSMDNSVELDWIFNVENQFIRKVSIGNIIICEIPKDILDTIKNIKNNVFLYTGCKEWIWLSERKSYTIEVEGQKKNVWIGEICFFQDVLDNTCLTDIINLEGIELLTNIKKNVKECQTIYARCSDSMYLLDDIHREYITKYQFKTNDIVAIKSVAGSGKTTTLLNLAKIHSKKKILYIAFNKSLITEIKGKIKTQQIKNLIPKTFDALLYKLYISLKNKEPDITNLRPQTIGTFIPWLNGKPYRIKDSYCKNFINFCNGSNINDIKQYNITKFGVKKPLLEELWEKVLQNKLITFESIRKQAYINRWFKQYIDDNYDMIMIDETQDFDMIMLKMLLNDTTIPKIFVGDPKQSIYQFRGCINAFKYLPSTSLIIEFYSTFRIGNPACNKIRHMIDDCWIISKCKNETHFVNHISDSEKYTHIFRTWRSLLTTAQTKQKIWINGFDKKINEIRNLHRKLINIKSLTKQEDTLDDDLPVFLKSLSVDALETLITDIENNIVDFKESHIKLYTVHAYKGLEDKNIKVDSDILCKNMNINMNINTNINKNTNKSSELNTNLFYVAITRGMEKILITN